MVFFAAVAGLVYAVSLFLQRGLGDSPLRAAVIGIGAASALAVPLLPRKPQADTGH